MSRQEKTPHEIHNSANVRRNFSFRGAAPSVIFMMSYLTACRYVVTRGRKVLSSPIFFSLCLSSYIAALCLSHSLYGKGISCANKGGNVARWALGKFSDIQEERDEAQSAHCTLPQQRQHKGPNHCSTSLAGKQPVCCLFWYLHCGVCESINGFLQKRKIKSETRERERTAASSFTENHSEFTSWDRCDANAAG